MKMRPTMLLFLISLSFSIQANSLSLSFPLTSISVSKTSPSSAMYGNSLKKSSSYGSYKLPFKFSTVLVVSLPIGTPPQPTELLLDTGSQLSWIQCHAKEKNNLKTSSSFDPSLSSSFSPLPCNNPVCKPRIPDFTIPTSCDQNHLCHYSYFYADGTLAEGNLVREKFNFSNSLTTPPVILGCAHDSTDNKGTLGMNLGRLSFVSQAKISKFSYCVPTRPGPPTGSDPPTATGSFYLGHNPNSARFKYVRLLTFPQSQRSPNLDPLAYTLPMTGIKIGGRRLNISAAVFRPDSTGSGQTMIDSGSELTYLVDEAYGKVRAEIVRRAGPGLLKKDFAYANVADMCFDDRHATEVAQRIGDMSFEFEPEGVQILVRKEHVLTEVERGVKCVGIGRSDTLGIASNIIGNVHQQNMWVEYDLTNRRIGFGGALCSRFK